MTKSDWRCPNCHKELTITPDGQYVCENCGSTPSPAIIDPADRDWNRIVLKERTE